MIPTSRRLPGRGPNHRRLSWNRTPSGTTECSLSAGSCSTGLRMRLLGGCTFLGRGMRAARDVGHRLARLPLREPSSAVGLVRTRFGGGGPATIPGSATMPLVNPRDIPPDQAFKCSVQVGTFVRNWATAAAWHLYSTSKRMFERPLWRTQAKFARCHHHGAGAFVDNLRLAQRVEDIPGAVVECGVWRGG